MVASRKRPKGVRFYGSLGLSVIVMGMMPRQIGYQDLASLMARQPEVKQRARAHMMASPFGTIHAATFSFPQPVGTLIPAPPSYRLVAVDPRDLDITGAIARELSAAAYQLSRPRLDFPTVNRALKGDLLVARPHPAPPPGPTRDLTPGRVKTVSFPKPADAAPEPEPPRPEVAAAPAEPKSEAAEPASSYSEAEVVTAALSNNRDHEAASQTATYVVASLPPSQPATPILVTPPLGSDVDSGSVARLGQFNFGNGLSGEAVGAIQAWPMDEEPLLQSPPAADPDIKLSALTPPDAKSPEKSAGQSVAPKGEVTGKDKRPKTPAERLRLSDKQRVKSEKCLAEAIYFESRGEPKRGQIAVAQVVMNRVFSGFYPSNVCGTVYQNAHRKLACQFTFACDGIPDVVNEPDMWAQAKQISRDMLDGKLWLPEIGHSTHYHAYWVHPSWVNEMRKLHRIGVHTFYRPRAWGNTVEVPNHKFVPPGKQS